MKLYRKIFRIFLIALGWLSLLSWLLWLFFIRFDPPLPTPQNPFQLFANEADDQLQHLFLNGINSAKKSIHLTLYSLNDPTIISLLEKKRAEGVDITLFHDPAALKSCHNSFKEKMHCIEKKERGLFHEKILIVDDVAVWVGSANLTKESLLLDANCVIALHSPEAALAMKNREKIAFSIGPRHITYFPLPECQKEALDTLLCALKESRISIQASLFTLTHPDIVAELKKAKERGVTVDLVIDHKMLLGASKKVGQALIHDHFPLYCMDERSSTFHHKLALIDDHRVILGSANWTKAAFEKNGESLLILDNLSENELKKMKKIFTAMKICREKIEERFFE